MNDSYPQTTSLAISLLSYTLSKMKAISFLNTFFIFLFLEHSIVFPFSIFFIFLFRYMTYTLKSCLSFRKQLQNTIFSISNIWLSSLWNPLYSILNFSYYVLCFFIPIRLKIIWRKRLHLSFFNPVLSLAVLIWYPISHCSIIYWIFTMSQGHTTNNRSGTSTEF